MSFPISSVAIQSGSSVSIRRSTSLFFSTVIVPGIDASLSACSATLPILPKYTWAITPNNGVSAALNLVQSGLDLPAGSLTEPTNYTVTVGVNTLIMGQTNVTSSVVVSVVLGPLTAVITGGAFCLSCRKY